MKMQNSELEFVTFDTQDVIATSGRKAWFRGSASLVPSHVADCDTDVLSWSWVNGNTNESIDIYINGKSKKFYGEIGNVYQLSEDSYYQTNGGGSTYIFEAVENGTDDGEGDELRSLDSIIFWLGQNPNSPQ